MFFTLNFTQSFLKKLRDGKLPSERELKRFLRDTANPFITDPNGDTALHLALREGFQELAESLIKAGAGLNVVGKDGKTPLILASEKSLDKIVRLLISRGADVNQMGKDGY